MFEHRIAHKLGNRHLSETFSPQAYKTGRPTNDGVLNNLKKIVQRAISKRGNARKLSDTSLTFTNTEPLKLLVNWDQLYKDTAKPFKTCFEVGDWYYTGPEYVTEGDIPSAPTCNPPEVSTAPCWGRCQADDVITEELREHFKTSVDAAVAKLEAALRVPKMSGNLVLKKSKGSYRGMYSGTWGWDTSKKRCGADTFYLCGASSPNSYCKEGVSANAIVYLTYNPIMNGGATGGPCEVDQLGRPITMIYNMRVSLAAGLRRINSLKSALTEDEFNEYKSNRYTSLSVHEMLHGLGFAIQMFQNAGIVELKNVYDSSGAQRTKDDALWHFEPSTRVSTLAKVHFNCNDDSRWHGLPLMGSAETGRDSHHNSFLLLEDVISKARGAAHSLALAPLEDMGFYLVDYSNSEYLIMAHTEVANLLQLGVAKNNSMDEAYVATDPENATEILLQSHTRPELVFKMRSRRLWEKE